MAHDFSPEELLARACRDVNAMVDELGIREEPAACCRCREQLDACEERLEAALKELEQMSPRRLRAADRMAAAIDHMIATGCLDARSPAGDARLDYGEPFPPDKAKRMFFDCEKADG